MDKGAAAQRSDRLRGHRSCCAARFGAVSQLCRRWPDLAVPRTDLVGGWPGLARGSRICLAAARFVATRSDPAVAKHGCPRSDLAGTAATGAIGGRRG